jgi:hypothetical protein
VAAFPHNSTAHWRWNEQDWLYLFNRTIDFDNCLQLQPIAHDGLQTNARLDRHAALSPQSLILSMALVSIASTVFNFRENRRNRPCRIQTSELEGQKVAAGARWRGAHSMWFFVLSRCTKTRHYLIKKLAQNSGILSLHFSIHTPQNDCDQFLKCKFHSLNPL